MTDDSPGWIVFPLGLLALWLFFYSMWLLSKSEEADKAGLPKTWSLTLSRDIVAASWIVFPLMRIFGLDDGLWLWIGRVLAIAFVVALPVMVFEETRRGSIRMPWQRDRQSGASPEYPDKIDRTGV